MDDVKKFIKTHKKLSIIIGVALVLLIFVIILYNAMFVYGKDQRLHGKRKVEISNKSQKSIATSLKEINGVSDVDMNIVTKEISFLVDVNEGVSRDASKNITSNILKELSDSEKDYYDIQLIVMCSACNADDETYPIMAYKNKTSKNFVWSNN